MIEPSTREEKMQKQCSRCMRVYSSNENNCRVDGADLVDTKGDPFIGTHLIERYQITERLGSGGWGVVYKGIHTTLQRYVAVKLLDSKLSVDHDRIRRFEQEAKLASELEHPNIVRVLDYGLVPLPFIVMDYVAGITLAELLETKTSLSPSVAVPIFTQMCDALKHAHAHKVVHRDIKPSNVMLLRVPNEVNYQVKILDFGLAKMVAEETRDKSVTTTGQTIGSPPYMSPEQCMAGVVDGRSDVYSMGCVIYETLTGALAFDAESQFDIMHKHVYETAPRISERHPGANVPACYGAIVERCLAKAPADRYQTMEALKEDLLAAAAGSQIKRPKGRPARRPPAKTNYALIAAGILAAIIASGAIVVWTNYASLKSALQQYTFEQGKLHFEYGKLVQSEEEMKLAARLAENGGQPNHALLQSLGYLSQIYAAEKKWAEQDKNNKRIAKLRQENPTARWTQLANESRVALAKGNLPLAEKKLEQALSEEHGKKTLVLARTYSGLGQAYYKDEKFQQAYNDEKQALAIREELLDPDDPDTAATLFRLGDDCIGLNNLVEAKSLLLNSLEIREKVLGWQDPDTGQSLNSLGVTCFKMREYNEAEFYFKKAVDLFTSVKGLTDETTVNSSHNLAEVYRAKKKFAEGEAIIQKLMAAQAKNSGYYAVCIHDLAMMRATQGKYQDALSLFEQALELRKHLLPATDPLLKAEASNIADMERRLKAAK